MEQGQAAPLPQTPKMRMGNVWPVLGVAVVGLGLLALLGRRKSEEAPPKEPEEAPEETGQTAEQKAAADKKAEVSARMRALALKRHAKKQQPDVQASE